MAIASSNSFFEYDFDKWISTFCYFETSELADTLIELNLSGRAEKTDQAQLAYVRKQFLRSCLLEWYFWDAASRQLTWDDFDKLAFKNDGSGLL